MPPRSAKNEVDSRSAKGRTRPQWDVRPRENQGWRCYLQPMKYVTHAISRKFRTRNVWRMCAYDALYVKLGIQKQVDYCPLVIDLTSAVSRKNDVARFCCRRDR